MKQFLQTKLSGVLVIGENTVTVSRAGMLTLEQRSGSPANLDKTECRVLSPEFRIQ